MAVVVGMGVAAKNGVLIKGGATLQKVEFHIVTVTFINHSISY